MYTGPISVLRIAKKKKKKRRKREDWKRKGNREVGRRGNCSTSA